MRKTPPDRSSDSSPPRPRYHKVDPRHYRLKEPPRGYHFVRHDNAGEIVLSPSSAA